MRATLSSLGSLRMIGRPALRTRGTPESGTARNLITWAAVLMALAEAAWLLFPPARALVLSHEETPAVRGYRLAAGLGCFSCHGPGGNGGTKNPGSEVGEVPPFGAQMMYVKDDHDLREYILDGTPRRKREDADCKAKVEAAPLRMPAYRAFLSASQVDDLVAFLHTTSGQILPHKALPKRGAERAAELGCFACHGPLGAGGVSNPGSFKGYIPGFWGGDFDELVRDDAELRQWIAEGGIPRISEHPIGRIFVRRQVIKMPAFGHGHLQSPEDIDALVAYVRWIRRTASRRATASPRSRCSRPSTASRCGT